MKKQLEFTYNLLAGLPAERRTTSSQHATFEAELRKYEKAPNDWAYEIKSTKGKLSELRAAESANAQAVHKALLENALEIEKALAEEVNKPIDLSDTKFVNALQIASLVNLD